MLGDEILQVFRADGSKSPGESCWDREVLPGSKATSPNNSCHGRKNMGGLASFRERFHGPYRRTGIARAWPYEPVVVELFDDMGAPAGHARHDENWRIQRHFQS